MEINSSKFATVSARFSASKREAGTAVKLQISPLEKALGERSHSGSSDKILYTVPL